LWEITAVLEDDALATTLPVKDAWAVQVTDKRLISKLIKFLEKVRPFSHKFIKRVNTGATGKNGGGGAAAAGGAWILYDFCDASPSEAQISQSLRDEGFEGCKVIKVKAPPRPPATRRQFEDGRNYWPIHFFENKELESLLSRSRPDVWGSEEAAGHASRMAAALKVGAEGTCGAVAIDPKDNGRVIARACDDPCHPIKHACMVLIDNVARCQGGGSWGAPFEEDTPTSSNSKDAAAAYLLTGCDVYVSDEPCIMCSMALVHSRVRRVFFNRPSHQGACKSLLKMNTISELNHSYQVFQMTSCISPAAD